MKKIMYLAFAMFAILTSCNNQKKQDSNSNEAASADSVMRIDSVQIADPNDPNKTHDTVIKHMEPAPKK